MSYCRLASTLSASMSIHSAARGGADVDNDWSGQLGGADDRFTYSHEGAALPKTLVDIARRGHQGFQVLQAAQIVDDAGVAQLEELRREMARLLADEDEGEPAFAATTGDVAQHLQGGSRGVDPVATEERVGFFDHQ